MKPEGVIVITLSVMCFAVAVIGAAVGEKVERARIYEKCMIEKQDDTHKAAVEFCRERVK
jgi:hypothetical protein